MCIFDCYCIFQSSTTKKQIEIGQMHAFGVSHWIWMQYAAQRARYTTWTESREINTYHTDISLNSNLYSIVLRWFCILQMRFGTIVVSIKCCCWFLPQKCKEQERLGGSSSTFLLSTFFLHIKINTPSTTS